MNLNQTDRYVSYKNIDCAGNAKKLLSMLRRHIDDLEKTHPFWEKFKGMLAQAGKTQENSDRKIDELFLFTPTSITSMRFLKNTRMLKQSLCLTR